MPTLFRIVNLLFIFCAIAFAQKQTHVAVISFVGDKTVSPEQLNFLTGKFASELMRTNVYKVLDRGKMDYILKEQGFQQSGACNTSECQVQMGQLLGVDAIVGGNLVRFGSKYAFRAELIDVGSGLVLYSAEVEESGELEDVYGSLCKRAAEDLARNVNAPVASQNAIAVPESQSQVELDAGIPAIPTKSGLSTKRKIALALWGGTLLGAGTGYYMDTKVDQYLDDYNTAFKAQNYAETKAAYDNGNSATSLRNISYGVSMGTLLVGAVLWFWPE